MDFGEKFPYALLTVSKTLSSRYSPKRCPADILQNVVQADYQGYTSPKSLSKLVIGYTTPQSLPARPAPHQLPRPTPHTPTIHQPHRLYTHPYPSSCELTATK